MAAGKKDVAVTPFGPGTSLDSTPQPQVELTNFGFHRATNDTALEAGRNPIARVRENGAPSPSEGRYSNPNGIETRPGTNSAHMRLVRSIRDEFLREHIHHLPEARAWRDAHATREGFLDALRREDARLLELVVHLLPQDVRSELAHDPSVLDRIDEKVRRLIDRSKHTENNGPLYRAARIAEACLECGILSDPRRERPITTETLIVALHKRELVREAAHLTIDAIREGLALKPATVLSTIGLLGRRLENRADLRTYAKLARTALEYGAVHPADPATAKVYDVVLALLGTPELLRDRASSRFEGERDILDVAERMLLAGDVGLEAVHAGVAFSTERSEARVNMLVRGLATAAMGVAAADRKLDFPGDRAWYAEVDRHIALDVKYPMPRPAYAESFDLPEIRETLLTYALQIANQALVRRTDGSVEERYKLEGSTVCTVLKGYHRSDIAPDTTDCILLENLVGKALDAGKRMHSKPIRQGVELILDSETGEAPYAATTILSRSLKAGYSFERPLLERAHQAAAGLPLDPITEQSRRELKLGISKLAALEERQARAAAAAAAPLRGGLAPRSDGTYVDFHDYLAKL